MLDTLRTLKRRFTKSAASLPAETVATPLSMQLGAWNSGIADEVRFWSDWFSNRGGEWPQDFLRRQDPDQPIDQDLLDDIVGLDPTKAKLLDVGAGPMTKLGKSHKGQRLDIVAVDPLAPFYTAIAKKYGVARPVETMQGFAEALTTIFEPESFDLTYCINALDHSFDPLLGIEEMLLVTKVGGKVVLNHYENEALSQEHGGLHQWNFTERSGDFIIWNDEKEINVTTHFGQCARTVTVRERATDRKPDKMLVSLYKTSSIAIDLPSRHRKLANDVLSAALIAFYASTSS